jgi:hypothetical protein
MDWTNEVDAKEIAGRLVERYEQLFRNIQLDKMAFIRNLSKKSDTPIKIYGVKYPNSIWNDHVYIMEIFDDCWGTLEQKQRNLAVAQALCSIHTDGFSESSKNYGKIVKPDIVSFMEVYVMSGGIPNYLNNPSVIDPLAGQDEDKFVIIPRRTIDHCESNSGDVNIDCADMTTGEG